MPRSEFSRREVEALLVSCHRRCCVCHRYCGVKMEVDHITSAGKDGAGQIQNAIALCFDCHAEVHHYNVAHPRGNKFAPTELRAHRDQWIRMCEEHPEVFAHSQPAPEAGSLERLLAELEFNRVVAAGASFGFAFEMAQFRRAIADGTFTWLSDGIKLAVHDAYAAIGEAVRGAEVFIGRGQSESAAIHATQEARRRIDTAIASLSDALSQT